VPKNAGGRQIFRRRGAAGDRFSEDDVAVAGELENDDDHRRRQEGEVGLGAVQESLWRVRPVDDTDEARLHELPESFESEGALEIALH
jgi:CO/xanthine dehydrogenase FAD-binding subunit